MPTLFPEKVAQQLRAQKLRWQQQRRLKWKPAELVVSNQTHGRFASSIIIHFATVKTQHVCNNLCASFVVALFPMFESLAGHFHVETAFGPSGPLSRSPSELLAADPARAQHDARRAEIFFDVPWFEWKFRADALQPGMTHGQLACKSRTLPPQHPSAAANHSYN